MTDPEQARREYIDALNNADRTDDLTSLLTIARSYYWPELPLLEVLDKQERLDAIDRCTQKRI